MGTSGKRVSASDELRQQQLVRCALGFDKHQLVYGTAMARSAHRAIRTTKRLMARCF